MVSASKARMYDHFQVQDGEGFEEGKKDAIESLKDDDLKEPEPGSPPKSEKKSKKAKKERRKSKSKKVQEVEDMVDYPVLSETLEDENLALEEQVYADMATNEAEEAPAVAPKSGRKSTKGKSKKAAEIQGVLVDENPAPEESDEPIADMPKSGKRSRKVNGVPRRRTRATSDAFEAPLAPRVQVEVVEEEEDMVAALNKARVLQTKLEVKNPRRSKRISSVEAEVPNVSTRARSRESSIDPTPLPAKLKTAKAKSRTSTRKSRKDIYDVPDDANDSFATLHQPGSRTKQRAASRPEGEPSAVSPIMEEVEEEELPKKLSKKSLGKRKASDVLVVASSKKLKRNDKAPAGTPQLHTFGFHSDDSSKSRSQPEKSHHILNPTPEALASTAQRLYAEVEDSPEESPPPPLRPIDPVSSQPRQLTQWTPINSPEEARAVMRPLPAKNQAQAQVLISPRVPSEPKSPSPAPEKEIPVPKSSEKKRRRRIPAVEPSSAIKPTSFRDISSISKSSSSRKASSVAPKSRGGSSLAPMSATKRKANEELESISEAVEEWRVGNDLTPQEINELVQRKIDSEVTKFWDHMAAQISGLTRVQIQQKCRRKFHNFDRGPWTEEQDTELRELYEKTPGKWVQIGSLLNRFPEDCRDRWRNYVVCGDKQRKDIWDKEEEDSLRVAVAECIEKIKEKRRKDGKSKMRDVDYESLLDWGTVSKEMGHTRSRLQCSSKWKQLKERMESDVEDPVAEAPVSENWRLEHAESEARRMSVQQKLDLLYAIRETAAGSEGKIPWAVITREHLRVRGMRMAYKICYRTIKQHIEGHEDMKLQEIVDQLIDAYEEAAPKEPKGFHKTFAASQQSIESRNSKTPQKRIKRKNDYVNEDSSGDDNGEGPSTTRFPASREPTVKRNMNDHASKPEDIDAPRPRVKSKAKPKVNGKSKGTKSDMMEEMSNENVESSAPKPKTKRRKLKQRMKQVDEKVSQETNEETAPVVPSDDDLEDVISSMKTGNSRTPRRSSQKARRNPNQQLSNQYVQSSDEGEPENEPEAHVVNETRLEDNDESDFAPADHQTHPEDDEGNPLAKESDVIDESESDDQHQGIFAAEIEESQPEAGGSDDDQDVNERGSYTALGGPGDDQEELFPDEDEEPTPTFHNRASVDLDADNDDEPRIVMNGWGQRDDPETSQEDDDEEEEDDDEEEEQRGRSLSKRSPSKKLGSQISSGDRDITPKANRYKNGYTNGDGKARDSSVSSEGSMSDIPASVPEWKLKGVHNRETSAEL